MKNPGTIFQEIHGESFIFCDVPPKWTKKLYKNSGMHESGLPKHYKNSGTHELGPPKQYKNNGKHELGLIFLEPESCVPFFSPTKIVRTSSLPENNSGTQVSANLSFGHPFHRQFL